MSLVQTHQDKEDEHDNHSGQHLSLPCAEREVHPVSMDETFYFHIYCAAQSILVLLKL